MLHEEFDELLPRDFDKFIWCMNVDEPKHEQHSKLVSGCIRSSEKICRKRYSLRNIIQTVFSDGKCIVKG